MAATKRTTKSTAKKTAKKVASARKRAVGKTAPARKAAGKRVGAATRTTEKATKRVARAVPAKRAATRKAASRTTSTRNTAARTAGRAAGAVKKQAAGARRTARVAKRAASTAPSRSTSGGSSPDAIALLKQDHREVEQLFKRFEKAGDGAVKAKAQLVEAMIEALSRHAEIEELVFYPAVRRNLPKTESDVLEALEEHHLVKVVLRELEGLDPRAERFDAKVTVMTELVRHHVEEEEGELFPKVRDRIDRRTLREMGDELRAAKRVVPTRPHPGAPDTPPGNVVAGAAVAVIDRARKVGKHAVDRVRDEVPSL